MLIKRVVRKVGTAEGQWGLGPTVFGMAWSMVPRGRIQPAHSLSWHCDEEGGGWREQPGKKRRLPKDEARNEEGDVKSEFGG